jgi:hypothetical protein
MNNKLLWGAIRAYSIAIAMYKKQGILDGRNVSIKRKRRKEGVELSGHVRI